VDNLIAKNEKYNFHNRYHMRKEKIILRYESLSKASTYRKGDKNVEIPEPLCSDRNKNKCFQLHCPLKTKKNHNHTRKRVKRAREVEKPRGCARCNGSATQ